MRIALLLLIAAAACFAQEQPAPQPAPPSTPFAVAPPGPTTLKPTLCAVPLIGASLIKPNPASDLNLPVPKVVDQIHAKIAVPTCSQSAATPTSINVLIAPRPASSN